MNRSVIRALLAVFIAMSLLTPVAANADLNGTPSGIPGIDYPIIPGVNAPAATGPALPSPGSLPPPLFNPDGSAFVPGTPIQMPVRADGGQYRYEFDPLTNMYVPLLPGAASPQPLDPFAGLTPLAPPLFNQDGTPFVAGSELQMPVRADGTQSKYQWDSKSGLYIPVVNGVVMSESAAIKPFYASDGSIIAGNGPITGSLISVSSIDPLTGSSVQVTYRSNLPPVFNPDGTTNDVNVIGSRPFDLTANASTVPADEQIGTYAVLDKNGVVVNTIDCSAKLCGDGGKFGGKIDEPAWAKGGCPTGCKLVMQIPPNPITGQSMGGFNTSTTSKVVYEGGKFKVTSNVGGKAITRTIENGVITDVTGERVSLSTGIQLPSVIKDAALKKQVDADLTAADITPIKKTKGYQLNTDDQLSAVDSTLKVVAIKKGVKAKTLSLTVDNQGELFVATTTNLTGYSIQIQRGSKVLKSVKVS